MKFGLQAIPQSTAFIYPFLGSVENWKTCNFKQIIKPEDHWSCIAHLIAEDMLKSAVIEEKKYKNIECKWFGPRSMTDLDLWYS